MAYHRPPRREGPVPSRGRKPGRSAPRTPRADSSSLKSEPGGMERLQKVLAHAGVGSRRACEDVILQGRVTVDGQVVRTLGMKVDPNRAKIAVDGQRIQLERMVYFAIHKPRGYVSTNNDPAGRPRVVDLLPEIPQRVYTVGRLDENSTGLMILTNDGELANRLAHPKYGVEKTYRAVVAGHPTREDLAQLTEGIWLAEGKVRAKRVRPVGRKGDATVLEIVLAEGKNREVRRMLAKLGHKVMALTRTAVGPITLRGLASGAARPLAGFEVDQLRKVAAGIAVSPAPFGAPREVRLPRRPRTSGAPEHQDRPRGPARGPAGGPTASRPPRRPSGPGTPGGPRRSAAAPSSTARPVHREGPPHVQRRSTPPPRPRPPVAPRPAPASRRIIGLDLEPDASTPSRPQPRPRRPGMKRRFPRAGLGPRRPRPTDEDSA